MRLPICLVLIALSTHACQESDRRDEKDHEPGDTYAGTISDDLSEESADEDAGHLAGDSSDNPAHDVTDNSAGDSTGDSVGNSAGDSAGTSVSNSAGDSAGTSANETAGSSSITQMNPFSSERRYTQNLSFTYDRAVTSGNPLKGFLTSYLWGHPNNDLPHSLEFAYVPLADIVPMPGTYDFEASIETHLQNASGRGHHLILRVYLDYPSRESGLPLHLRNSVSCSPYQDYGGGCSPNYQDPNLQATILDFIQALGTRYDGDQRIAFIQIGLLGFWGEWHTYPHNTWFADDRFQQSVITAFDQAFEVTPIQLRIPAQDSPQRIIGFHDDSFTRSTIGDIGWYFWPKLLVAQADRRWEVAPMGGEVYPEYQGSLLTDAYPLDIDHQDPLTAIQVTHMSYLLNYQAFNMNGVGYLGEQRLRAEQMSNAMGYEFTVESTTVEAANLEMDHVDLTVSVAIKNSGVAPFYYPLTLTLTSHETETVWTNDLELNSMLPNDEAHLVIFELPAIETITLTQGFSLQLDSPHLLEGQVIHWANQEQSEGILLITSDFYCTLDTSTLLLGASAELSQGRCFCDVDGILYTLDGRVCSP